MDVVLFVEENTMNTYKKQVIMYFLSIGIADKDPKSLYVANATMISTQCSLWGMAKTHGAYSNAFQNCTNFARSKEKKCLLFIQSWNLIPESWDFLLKAKKYATKKAFFRMPFLIPYLHLASCRTKGSRTPNIWFLKPTRLPIAP